LAEAGYVCSHLSVSGHEELTWRELRVYVTFCDVNEEEGKKTEEELKAKGLQ
jgi:hypothetical protein